MVSPRRLSACSLGELAEIAGFDARGLTPGIAFTVDDYAFAEAAWCCGKARSIGRFVSPIRPDAETRPDAEKQAKCANCQRPLAPQPYFLHRSVPGSAAPLETPVEKLGASDVRYVAVRRGDAATLLQGNVGQAFQPDMPPVGLERQIT